MLLADAAPSAWHEVLFGAAGNLIGGFGATLLWWAATLWAQRRQLNTAITQKRNAISLEAAKIRAWLRLVKEEPERASATLPARSSQVLSAVVRLGPDVTGGRSLEPMLGELEHRLGMVEAAAARLFAATTGIATAMRGNEQEVERIRQSLPLEAGKALGALDAFEGVVLKC